jgi:hypothetical protein
MGTRIFIYFFLHMAFTDHNFQLMLEIVLPLGQIFCTSGTYNADIKFLLQGIA